MMLAARSEGIFSALSEIEFPHSGQRIKAISVSSLWHRKVNYASNPSFFSLPRTADALRFRVIAISLTGTDFLYRSMRQSS